MVVDGDDSLSGHIEFSAFKINSIRVIQIRMEFFAVLSFLIQQSPVFSFAHPPPSAALSGFSATDCVESAAASAALRFEGILSNFKRLFA